jgi:hypothetical protein
MTNAFVKAYRAQPFQTYPDFMEALHRNLRKGGFSQKPQLSSTQAFELHSRVFSLKEGIVPNTNSQIGRVQRRKKRAKWANMLSFGGGGAGGAAANAMMAGVAAMALMDFFD